MNYGSVTIIPDNLDDFLDTDSDTDSEQGNCRSDDFLNTNSASDSEEDVPPLREETEEEINERRRNLLLAEGRSAYVNFGQYLERNFATRQPSHYYEPVRPVLAPRQLIPAWTDVIRANHILRASVEDTEIRFVQPEIKISSNTVKEPKTAKIETVKQRRKLPHEREKEFH